MINNLITATLKTCGTKPGTKDRLIISNRDLLVDGRQCSWDSSEKLIGVRLSRQLSGLIVSDSNVELDSLELEWTEVRFRPFFYLMLKVLCLKKLMI